MKDTDNRAADETAAGPQGTDCALEFSLLGELRVSRGGQPLRLPPSRKTRALLAYLILNGRDHRRDRLCSMFWDVTDDPRGALRWSLSKLRGLVDDDGQRRIQADREHVAFHGRDCHVDVRSLRDTLQNADLDAVPIGTLRDWAGRFRGELLEGLDLPDFDDYQAWCVAEREQTRKLRARILSTLTRRLTDRPEEALTHAREWVQVDPLNHEARLDLLRLAMAAGRRDEAEQHYESGRRLLEELGSRHAGELIQAWRDLKARAHDAVLPTAAAIAPGDAGDGSAGDAQPPTGAPTTTVTAAPSTRPTLVTPGLVGREREFAQLKGMVDQVAQERREQMVLLRGEPGIGKTRLLQALRQAAVEAGARVLEGASYEGETTRPYGPFIDALRDLPATGTHAGEVGRDGTRSPLLRELDQAKESDGGRDRLFAGVGDLIAVSAHDAPSVVLILDDVQWLDRASAELLHYLGRTGKHRPVLIVLAAREEELTDNAALGRVLRSLRRDLHVTDLLLGALDLEAITAIVDGAGSKLSAQQVFKQSGGNALFALELARSWSSGDSLPESLAEAVRDRIERLPQHAIDVLRWGALLGASFSIARLETLMALDLEALVDALEALERHALLRAVDGGVGYVFTHEVVRRVAYADLSEPRRVLMHRRVASGLQAQLDADGSLDDALVAEVAHHATLGHDDGLAATACARAGQRCLRIFANEQAAALARRGLRHAARLPDPERLQRIIELQDVLLQAEPPADRALTVRELEGLAQHALELGLQAHSRLAFSLLAYLSWEGGNWDAAQDRVMQAEVATRGTDGVHRVQALAEAGRCLVLLERDLPEAHAILMEAQARGRAADYEPAEVPDGLGMIKLHQGHLEEAGQLFERARRLAAVQRSRLVEYHTLEHAALLALEQRNFEALAGQAAEMVTLGEKLREGSEAPFARALAGLAAYAGSEDALEQLEQALQELRVVDAKHRLAVSLNQAALIEIDRDQPERAQQRAAEALPIARLLERPSEMLLALSLLARASQHHDDADAHERYRSAILDTPWDGRASTNVRRRAQVLLGEPLTETQPASANTRRRNA